MDRTNPFNETVFPGGKNERPDRQEKLDPVTQKYVKKTLEATDLDNLHDDHEAVAVLTAAKTRDYAREQLSKLFARKERRGRKAAWCI